MPVKKGLTERLELIKTETEGYFDKTAEYYKLWSLKTAAKVSGTVARLVLITIMVAFALFFLSVAAVVAIGNALGEMVYGLLIVAGIYLLLAVIVFYLSRKFVDPAIIRGYTRLFYKNDADE
ncbi:hypothetical protein [Avrilella dinanensis]|uniref:hypothetical protein n=1 Tax=Avrilella dinanensis TaxID=2008672 RepID=UPI00240A738C|nr:hypothetical protein [Avrilella dinanensis]